MLTLLGFQAARSETLVYREIVEQDSIWHTYRCEFRDSVYFWESISRQDGEIIEHITALADSNLVNHSCRIRNAKGNDVQFERRKNKVKIYGKHHGEEFEKTVKLDKAPWAQMFPIFLEDFVASGQQSTEFWVFHPDNLRKAKFRAEIKYDEIVQVDGVAIKSVLVKVSFSNLLSLFWSGKYWYRKSDSRFVRYEGTKGPFTPVSVYELMEEKE